MKAASLIRDLVLGLNPGRSIGISMTRLEDPRTPVSGKFDFSADGVGKLAQELLVRILIRSLTGVSCVPLQGLPKLFAKAVNGYARLCWKSSLALCSQQSIERP